MELPFLGFDENTRRAIEERGDEGTGAYMATSPHAAYDATRNLRAIANKENELLKEDGDEDFLVNTQETPSTFM